MSAIEEWKKGKPSEVAAGAHFLALVAPDVSEALTEMRNQVDISISQPPIALWLNYYTRHRIMLNLFTELFSMDTMKMLIVEGSNETVDLSTPERDQLIHLYLRPETLFFLKVWAPCSIHYKTDPTTLFRRARQGKISAFEKLLRLDNSVIFDKRLAELFHQQKGRANRKNYRKLLLAFSRPVPEKTDPKRIKTLVAGLISYLSERTGKRLTEPQIRKLFDAIAKDNGLGLQDEDIPQSPETFSQAIRREAKRFKSLEGKPYKR